MGDQMTKIRKSNFTKGYAAAMKAEAEHRKLTPRLKRYKLTPLRHCLEDEIMDKHARLAVEGKGLRWENTTEYA